MDKNYAFGVNFKKYFKKHKIKLILTLFQIINYKSMKRKMLFDLYSNTGTTFERQNKHQQLP